MSETTRLMQLKSTIDDLSSKKIVYEERLRNEKKRLETLLKEITAKGYDPKKLKDTVEEKEALLKKSLDDLEEKTADISKKLSAIEGL